MNKSNRVRIVPTQGRYQNSLHGTITRETHLFLFVDVVCQEKEHLKTVKMKFSKTDYLRTGLDKEAFPRYKLERANDD